MKVKRGRPRQFNSEQALQAAMEVFWSKGFTATSLDELSSVTGMTRPSLYNAFGSKEEIYRLALKHFVEMMREQVTAVLFSEPDLKSALLLFYQGALDVYYTANKSLGCFVTCTAAVEAGNQAKIRDDFIEVIKEVDLAFEKRLTTARDQGLWPREKEVKPVAQLLHATLQSCALRARATASRKEVTKMYTAAVNILCDPI